MDLQWSKDEQAFQDEVGDFLEQKLTPELQRAGRLMTSVYADHDASMAWQAILHERGWAAPAWPVEFGGCDWSLTQHYIFTRESTLAGAPSLSPMGIRMVAHAIIRYGTEAQKEFFLPRILTGEVFFCQGYSEPEAGSDLAALSMAASTTATTWCVPAARSGQPMPPKRIGCSRWCAPRARRRSNRASLSCSST